MSKKILLVEDEALIAMNEARMLEKHGYEVVTAYNGENAVEAVDSDPDISLILMDIDLGCGIDGIEAAEEILSRGQLPILFITSHSEKEYVDRVKKITNYGYMIKNSGDFVLIESIEMAFRLFDSWKKLQEKEEQLNLAMDAADHGYWDWNLDTNETYFSPNYCKMLGYEPGEIKNHYQSWETLLHPEDRENAIATVEEKIKLVEPFEHEFRLRTKTGKWKWIKGKGNSYHVDLNGTPHRVVGTHEDITERKEVQEALKKSEERYRLLFNYSNDAIFVYEMGEDNYPGKIVEVNQEACRLYKYSKDELLRMSIKDITAKEDIVHLHHNAEKLIEQKQLIFEAKDVGSDGVVIPVEVSAYLYTEGNTDYVVANVRDITERKKAEELLLQRERQYRSIYNSLREALIIVNANREITDCNTAFTELFGYSLSEIQGKTTDILFASKDEFEQLGKKMQQQDVDSGFIDQPLYRTKTGEVFRGEKKVQYLRDENGSPVGFIGLIRDITERTRAQGALEEANLRLTTIIDSIDATIYISDMETYEIVFVNKHGRRMHGSDITGEKCFKAIQGRDEPCPFCTNDKLVDKDGNPTGVFSWVHYNAHNGRWFDCRDSAVQWFDGRIVRMELATDITERKQQEEKLQKALKEKDFLMRELNHRVKNNLAMVSSLISLKDSEIDYDLSDLKHRIDIIKLVHEKLHQHNDIEHIEVKEYFQELLEAIFYSSSRQSVQIINKVEDVSIPTKGAIPLGLVVNEIATNALKYGFTDHQEARFSVDMRKDSDSKHYILSLSNTGNPFPDEIGLENPETMGLQLISILVSQLKGTIELQKSPHPVFTIRFPVEE